MSIQDYTLCEHGYFRWLCDSVNLMDSDKPYYLLFHQLFECSFVVLIDSDENRVKDCLNLREKYAEETGDTWIFTLDKPVCVLEILLTLSERMEYITPSGDKKAWIWEYLDNLDLSKFTDELIGENYKSCLDSIKQKLTYFVERTYNKDGVGSIFPLKNMSQNQRKTELWYQMQAYILENYLIDDA